MTKRTISTIFHDINCALEILSSRIEAAETTMFKDFFDEIDADEEKLESLTKDQKKSLRVKLTNIKRRNLIAKYAERGVKLYSDDIEPVKSKDLLYLLKHPELLKIILMTETIRDEFYRELKREAPDEYFDQCSGGLYLSIGPLILPDSEALLKPFLIDIIKNDIHTVIANGNLFFEKEPFSIFSLDGMARNTPDFIDYFGAEDESWQMVDDGWKMRHYICSGQKIILKSRCIHQQEKMDTYELIIDGFTKEPYDVKVRNIKNADNMPSLLNDEQLEALYDDYIAAKKNGTGLKIHCAGGLGRTGNIFLALLELEKQIFPDEYKEMPDLSEGILERIKWARGKFRKGLIQSPEQALDAEVITFKLLAIHQTRLLLVAHDYPELETIEDDAKLIELISNLSDRSVNEPPSPRERSPALFFPASGEPFKPPRTGGFTRRAGSPSPSRLRS